MKKVVLLAALFSVSYVSMGQNTFPTTGNVGIGTTTPTRTLDVNGAVNISGQSFIGSGGYDVSIGNASSSVIKMLRAGYNYISAEHASGDLVFRTGAVNRFIIKSNSEIDFFGGSFIFKNGNKDWSLYPHNDDFYIRNITDGSNIVQISFDRFKTFKPIYGIGGAGQHIFESSSDAPLRVTSTDIASGIKFVDPNGQGSLYFYGNSNADNQRFVFTDRVDFKETRFWRSNSEYLMKSYNTSVGSPEQFSIRHNLENVELKNDRGNINFISEAVFDNNVIVNSGKVGLGTTNPEYIMDVVSSVDDYKQFRVKSPGSPLIKLSGSYNTGNGAEFWQNTSGDIRLNINSTTSGLFIKSNGYLGIGTTTPEGLMHLKGNSTAGNVLLKMELDGNRNWEFLQDGSGPGTGLKLSSTANKTFTLASSDFKILDPTDQTYGLVFKPGNSTDRGGKITAGSTHDHSLELVNNGAGKYNLFVDGNIGIGTTTPDAKLAVNGKIHTKEVKVDLVGWPDYVFAKEYKLRTIEEVEKHIKEKGYLPNMPSAKEVEKNGVLLGEMNKKLLEKIEELTLYTIAQEKELKKRVEKDQKQEKRLQTLEEENKELKKALRRIEAFLQKKKN